MINHATLVDMQRSSAKKYGARKLFGTHWPRAAWHRRSGRRRRQDHPVPDGGEAHDLGERAALTKTMFDWAMANEERRRAHPGVLAKYEAALDALY